MERGAIFVLFKKNFTIEDIIVKIVIARKNLILCVCPFFMLLLSNRSSLPNFLLEDSTAYGDLNLKL